jgi:membrane-bound ClpP family serine protease
MSTGGVTRRLADAVREGVSMFLGIAGVVAIIIGLLYLVADGELPHVLQGTMTTGPDLRRAVACLGGGIVCVGAAWLIRVRRRA